MNSQTIDSSIRDDFEAELARFAYPYPPERHANGTYRDCAIQALWNVLQAAWTRKPAAQVAGAEPAAWMNPKEGCVMDAFIWSKDPASPRYNTPVYTHPAPEPDATKVVSVPDEWPMPYEDDDSDDSRIISMQNEITAWRALAADMGRT